MFSVPGIKGEYFKLMDDLGRDLFSDHYNGDLKPDAKVVIYANVSQRDVNKQIFYSNYKDTVK